MMTEEAFRAIEGDIVKALCDPDYEFLDYSDVQRFRGKASLLDCLFFSSVQQLPAFIRFLEVKLTKRYLSYLIEGKFYVQCII